MNKRYIKRKQLETGLYDNEGKKINIGKPRLKTNRNPIPFNPQSKLGIKQGKIMPIVDLPENYGQTFKNRNAKAQRHHNYGLKSGFQLGPNDYEKNRKIYENEELTPSKPLERLVKEFRKYRELKKEIEDKKNPKPISNSTIPQSTATSENLVNIPQARAVLAEVLPKIGLQDDDVSSIISSVISDASSSSHGFNDTKFNKIKKVFQKKTRPGQQEDISNYFDLNDVISISNIISNTNALLTNVRKDKIDPNYFKKIGPLIREGFKQTRNILPGFKPPIPTPINDFPPPPTKEELNLANPEENDFPPPPTEEELNPTATEYIDDYLDNYFQYNKNSSHEDIIQAVRILESELPNIRLNNQLKREIETQISLLLNQLNKKQPSKQIFQHPDKQMMELAKNINIPSNKIQIQEKKKISSAVDNKLSRQPTTSDEEDEKEDFERNLALLKKMGKTTIHRGKGIHARGIMTPNRSYIQRDQKYDPTQWMRTYNTNNAFRTNPMQVDEVQEKDEMEREDDLNDNNLLQNDILTNNRLPISGEGFKDILRSVVKKSIDFIKPKAKEFIKSKVEEVRKNPKILIDVVKNVIKPEEIKEQLPSVKKEEKKLEEKKLADSTKGGFPIELHMPTVDKDNRKDDKLHLASFIGPGTRIISKIHVEDLGDGKMKFINISKSKKDRIESYIVDTNKLESFDTAFSDIVLRRKDSEPLNAYDKQAEMHDLLYTTLDHLSKKISPALKKKLKDLSDVRMANNVISEFNDKYKGNPVLKANAIVIEKLLKLKTLV